jgi:intracellular multiplication protein IcmL
MNSQMEANVADEVSSIFSEEAITSTYLINQKNAERSKLFLSMATLLGLYVMVATLVLAIKASNPPGLLTFLNDHISSAQLVTPHRNPPVTDRQAIHWARDRVCDLLSLHFKKYSDQVSRRKSYFAGDGWLFYQQSLLDNNVIKTIKEEGLIITAINQGTPRLLQKYRLDGKINWRIEMPILQTIQGASDTPETVRKVVSVTVEESRRDESIEGLKIRVFGVIE